MAGEIRRRGRPKAFNEPEGEARVKAVDRALDVLDAIAASDGISLSRLADQLDESVATIHRVLGTLEHRDFVECGADDQLWRVGSGAFRLGSSFLRRTNVVEQSRPALRQLMQSCGETANLGMEKEGFVLFLSQVETHEAIRAFFPPGTLSPLHASGIGKALLSTYDAPRFETFCATVPMVRFTDKTLTSAQDLARDIALARQRGFAVDDEEKSPGMRCVAAPIRNHHGEAVAGISVSGPTHRMGTERLDEIGAHVKAAATEVSRRLGAA
ncbi:HTH-type transcriptional regulator BhcR [Aureimonas altamirensis]|uniref:HTH-type transcriptional regulator BhcR n=1 Tax=Aureimonas altamirensis TaxID=370622 RepID=UPI00301AE9A6